MTRVRPAWIEVDAAAVAHNTASIRELVWPSLLCAVVKANGYAHGAAEVAAAALAGGADWLAVALVEEGRELRDAGITAPILLLSESPLGAFDEVVSYALCPTLYTVDGVEAAASAAIAADVELAVHLKVNTGMNRVGAPPAELLELARLVDASPVLKLQALWTHLATADEPLRPETGEQLDRFCEAVEEVVNDGIEVEMLHAANSAASLAFPESRLDMVRPGIALYGVPPSPILGDQLDLRPALSVKAEVSFVKRVAAGESISYGLRHTFDRDTTEVGRARV